MLDKQIPGTVKVTYDHKDRPKLDRLRRTAARDILSAPSGLGKLHPDGLQHPGWDLKWR